MGERPKGVNGAWTGYYTYGGWSPVRCPFNAWLIEEAGAVTGETIEPNTFTYTSVTTDELMAALSGHRSGSDIGFIKTYTDLEIERIAYDGQVDAGFKRIEGTWRILNSGIFGDFVMIREPLSKKSQARAMEAT